MKVETTQLYERARSHLIESARTKQELSESGLDAIVQAARSIADGLRNGGKLLLCGNGGSAADCQHIAAELVSLLTQEFNRPGLKAISLTTDTSMITAYANDFGFEGVFARQVEALGMPGDTLIGISTSGNSKNVVKAVETAKTMGINTIAMTGATGGVLANSVNILIAVPSKCTQHIQESHITIGHILCDLIECYLFDEKLG
jgi:D-sedoheptulose 7-phosphate isomerase